MLLDLEDFANQYVPKESNIPDEDAQWIECLFKINNCVYMEYNQVVLFVTYMIFSDQLTAVKISKNFMSVVTKTEICMSNITRETLFRGDDSYISLTFCKFRACLKSKYNKHRAYYSMRPYMLINVKSER